MFIRTLGLALLGCTSALAAQGIPGTNVTADVNVVALSRSGDTTLVTYVITNQSSSLEKVLSLTIETPAAPVWISSPTPQLSWIVVSMHDARPVVGWAALADSILQPGSASQQLSFRALGLPGLVDAHIQGDAEPPPLDSDQPDSLSDVDPLLVNAVQLKVVGVDTVPQGATFASLTLRLDSLTTAICTLGWINTSGTCTGLHGYLLSTTPQLQSFLSLVAAEHGASLNDNAFWLLKVNAEYLQSLGGGSQPSPVTLYLHGSGGTANPLTLTLDSKAPTGSSAKYKDSPSIKFSGGNVWKDVGSWSAAPAVSSGQLTVLGNGHFWISLRNSDDQGTRFDLRLEVYKDGTLVASSETYCIQGVTTNPNSALEVFLAFGSFTPVTYDGTSNVLSVRMRTRIGTNGSGSSCGGHSNATGLRLYFDSTTRPSKFGATF